MLAVQKQEVCKLVLGIFSQAPPYQHQHDPTYDEEPDKPEFKGELSFEVDDWHQEYIHPDYQEGYDY